MQLKQEQYGKAVPEIHFGGRDISFIDPKYRFAYITLRVEGAEQCYIPWSFCFFVRGVLHSIDRKSVV